MDKRKLPPINEYLNHDGHSFKNFHIRFTSWYVALLFSGPIRSYLRNRSSTLTALRPLFGQKRKWSCLEEVGRGDSKAGWNVRTWWYTVISLQGRERCFVHVQSGKCTSLISKKDEWVKWKERDNKREISRSVEALLFAVYLSLWSRILNDLSLCGKNLCSRGSYFWSLTQRLESILKIM